MKDFAKWSLVHTLHWAVLYGAFAAQLEGAMYFLKFWVWVMAFCSLFLMAEKATAEAAKRPPRPVRAALNWLQAWATIGLLILFGHIASALAWGLVMLMMSMHHDATRKARMASATSAA